MNKKYIFYLIFGLVLLVHLAVRVVGLNSSPASINWDEASLGYNAYSLLKTGKDEYGNPWPVALRSFNDYKPALYSYLSMVPIYFLGLGQTSVRLVSAVAGTASLIALWLIINFYLKNRWLSLLMVGLLGFGPLRLHFSRVALEANLSMCFFSFGIYFWLTAIGRRSRSGFGWAIISFFLAMLSYHSARLAAPILVFLSALDFVGPTKRRWLAKFKLGLVATLVLGILLVGIVLASNGDKAVTRFDQESLFGKLWPFVSREVFDGKVAGWFLANPFYHMAGRMTGHLMANLSLANFGANIYHWIQNSVQFVPGAIWLGPVETLFLGLGLAVIILGLKEWRYRYLVYVFLATAAPMVVTWNWFHTLRTANMTPVLELAVVFGWLKFWQALKRKQKTVFVGLGVAVMIFQVSYIVNNELVYAPVENNGTYQPGGFDSGVEIIKGIERDYDRIVVDTPHANAHIFFLFYNRWDPLETQALADKYFIDDRGNRILNFGKYEFRPIDWGKDWRLKRTILWMGVGVKPEEVEAVGGKMWMVPGVSRKYPTATIVALP